MKMTDIKLPFKNKHILVVDDEPFLREAIIYDIKKRGAIVYEAEDGSTALEIVKNNSIDMVISDIRMPNGDGISLLDNIRLFHATTPAVLLVSGFSDFTESEVMLKGACALMDKPIDRMKMLDLVSKALKAI
jgi:YesN/AraC family two-component response regulator